MFYADFLFVKRGALSKVWQCAHLSKKLTRRDVRETDVRQAVRDIEQPSAPLALRLQGQLLLGVVRVYDGQVRYLQQDCTEASTRLTSLMDRKAASGRGHPTEADPATLVAPAGAITVSDREQLHDGYDALEEQRYLEDHALRLSSSQLDPNHPYPSLSLSLSSSQLTPLTETQSNQRLSQQARPSDISLEQARRSQLSLNLDDIELGEGMALDEEGAMDLGGGGGVEDMGGNEIEMMRDEGMEMGRVSMQEDGASLQGEDGRRESLISLPGDVSVDAAQVAADAELIRRREERRQQRKRLRFAGEVRDAVIERSSDEIRGAMRDNEDIVRSRAEESIVNPRRWLLHEGLSALLSHSSIMGRIGDAQMDALMEELFSPAGLRLPASGDESKEAMASEAHVGDGLENLVGGEFDVGLGVEDYDQGGGVPSTPPPSSPTAPRSPSTVAGSAMPPTLPPPSRSDLEATAAVDEAASTSLHSFFNEPETEPAATQTTDSSTLTSRTVKTLALLSTHYARSPDTAVPFTQLTTGRVGRGVAAGLFYQMLVLGQAGAVRCVQEEEYGEIEVAKGDRFEEVITRLGGTPEVRAAGRRVAARR